MAKNCLAFIAVIADGYFTEPSFMVLVLPSLFTCVLILASVFLDWIGLDSVFLD